MSLSIFIFYITFWTFIIICLGGGEEYWKHLILSTRQQLEETVCNVSEFSYWLLKESCFFSNIVTLSSWQSSSPGQNFWLARDNCTYNSLFLCECSCEQLLTLDNVMFKFTMKRFAVLNCKTQLVMNLIFKLVTSMRCLKKDRSQLYIIERLQKHK